MALGRGCSAPAPAAGCFPGCLQGWEQSPGLLLPAWAGGHRGQHHNLEMLAQGSARGYGTKGLGKDRGHREMGREAARTGTVGGTGRGGEKTPLRASAPPEKSCYEGQQAGNQARVPFDHLHHLGRAVPFPPASAKPRTRWLLVAQRWKAVNLYSFPGQYSITIYLRCGWGEMLDAPRTQQMGGQRSLAHGGLQRERLSWLSAKGTDKSERARGSIQRSGNLGEGCTRVGSDAQRGRGEPAARWR